VNGLTLLAYHHGHGYGGGYGGGWTDWIAHMVVSSAIHAMVYSFIFRMMHHLTLGEAAALVGIVLLVMFMWGRSRDRRGW